MPRQGNNIYLRKDGRWEGRYAKGRVDGKISYGYVFGKTYEDAEQKRTAAMDTSSAVPSKPESTFEAVSWEWLRIQKPELKASSYSKYKNLLNSYLIPSFGSIPIQSIDRRDALKFSRDLLLTGGVKGNGLSPKTVNSILSVLKNVLGFAVSEKGLNVADLGDVSVRQPQKPMRILSCNEQAVLSEHLCKNLTPCHLGILLCLYTGIRIGEICALRWGDIFPDEQYLFIHQSMQRIQTETVDGRKTAVIIQKPKSDCSIRKIPIPDEMLGLLISPRKQKEAFLLTGTDCHFMEPRCLENQFKAVTKACGISNVNFHALRHTFATRCVELGFDIKSLSEILGHASVNITLNRYVHPSMELKQKNMNRLSALLTTK